MGIVDHHQGVVAFGKIADLPQFGNVAVHGKHSIGTDQTATTTLGIG
jgi:hypothetical protein